MPDTATIYKTGQTDDGQGGRTEEPQIRQADVPCGFGPVPQRGGSAEEVVADRPTAQGRWLFRMPAGTPIKPTDVVVVDGDPLQYRVEQLRSPRGSWSLLTRFEAETIDVGGPAGE